MTIYLVNAFSPSMLSQLPVSVEFSSVDVKEFCDVVTKGVNAIGHKGTADLVSILCGTTLQVNRISIKAIIGDEIYVISLNFRLEEGRVLSTEEVQRAYNEGKVMLLKATLYGAVLGDLAKCENTCDEKTYDSLANKAKRG